MFHEEKNIYVNKYARAVAVLGKEKHNLTVTVLSVIPALIFYELIFYNTGKMEIDELDDFANNFSQ